ncbi:PREDICTED: cytochrome c oxidase subunit 4 isoform 1, mitochondrial-like [Nicrophorus vespilloides]|uniref:Cytochrome c oxidase subunit 4 n=1 Tax=Nicrophorus vespilloides TaxID=110193 RepID=A0ABM1MSD4_NICVS|nr:PREDICTED: cytochrome c oxidase subunit 4 isoform 1, mitochondrial-like [Nicrophorus vespilloides]
MAGRLLALSARSIKARPVPLGAAGAHSNPALDATRAMIGNREIVGYGMNGQPHYYDRSDIPLPAIRWKEATADIKCLREKEKGDWRQLSMEEKKALYRASFKLTYSEFKAPTGEWKQIVGASLMLVSVALWFYMAVRVVTRVPLPDSFSEEKQQAQLRRILDLHVNPITGLSSQWDYEKDDWKK